MSIGAILKRKKSQRNRREIDQTVKGIVTVMVIAMVLPLGAIFFARG